MKSLTPKQEQRMLAEGGYNRIVGIDEVGRGCWAGPVAVGAYIYHPQLPLVRGVADSKVVVAAKREQVYAKLKLHEYRVHYGSPQEIDAHGISVMIENLIAKIMEEFQDGSTLFLVDGQFKRNFGQHSRKIIDGDALYYSIAAASILAKVERDALMTELAKQYPDYGFEHHKGYGTKEHQGAIARVGICDLHRRSWHPISVLVTPQLGLELA